MTEIIRGLDGIVAAETRLSRVDGQAGRLTIGGFPIGDLAPRASYEEVLFLLWNDRLPTASELGELRAELARRRGIPDVGARAMIEAARSDIHPMDALRIGAASLALRDRAPLSETRQANTDRALDLIAAFPTLVAAYWRASIGTAPVDPDPDLGHAANYLYMLTGEKPLGSAVRALETYLNTVVDHGMNASTFAARVIVSTRSDMNSAICGAIGALKGPLHGGAPGPALDMVFAIQQESLRARRDVADVAREWVEKKISSGERIMGFGHRVYRVRDPRAEVLDAAAALLFAGRDDRAIYVDARIVEKEILAALARAKPGRRLRTNVEFYTALVLHGIGLNVDLFSPTFAVGRVGGWTAHVLEQIDDDRLIRPRAAYTGVFDREWTSLEDR